MSFPSVFWAAPMAGVTDPAFRDRLRRNGCRYLFTEMVSAAALSRGNRKTLACLVPRDMGPDLALQLFGADPGELAAAAALAAQAGFAHLDFNMGCPVRKVVRSGAGSALLTDLPRAARCIEALRGATPGRLTVKIRSGWAGDKLNYLEVGRLAQEAGADGVTLHGRTRAQGYAGDSDWSHVAELVRHLEIPVIGNGDVMTGPQARERLEASGCAAVMIGRGCLSSPWLFDRAERAIRGEALAPPPSLEAVGADLVAHLDGAVADKGPRVGVIEMRKFLAWGTRGMEGATAFRRKVQTIDDPEAVRRETRAFFGLAPVDRSGEGGLRRVA